MVDHHSTLLKVSVRENGRYHEISLNSMVSPAFKRNAVFRPAWLALHSWKLTRCVFIACSVACACRKMISRGLQREKDANDDIHCSLDVTVTVTAVTDRGISHCNVFNWIFLASNWIAISTWSEKSPQK